MAADDLDRHVVVRVADEIVVDLMASACGIGYAEASPMTDHVEIYGVVISFADARLVWQTKDTVRDKDKGPEPVPISETRVLRSFPHPSVSSAWIAALM